MLTFEARQAKLLVPRRVARLRVVDSPGRVRSVLCAALLFSIGVSSRVEAADLAVWDLASLYGMSEAIVLVDELRASGVDEPATARVTRVYRGDLTVGSGLAVVPWASDLAAPSSSPDASRAILFLERQDGGALWSLLPSGARLVIDGGAKMLRLGRAGARRYAWTEAGAEAVDVESYGLHAFEADLAACRKRLGEASRLAVGPLALAGGDELGELLALEAARAFSRGRANSSLLVSALAERLVDLGELERAFAWRERLPYPGAGAGLRQRLAIAARLDDVLLPRVRFERGVDELRRAIRYLLDDAERLPMVTRQRVLESMLDGLVEDAFEGAAGASVERAIARLLPRTQLPDSSVDRIARLLEWLESADGDSVHRLAPVLAETWPDRCLGALHAWHPLYAWVEVQTANAEEIRGRVHLARIASAHTLDSPTLVLERLDGTRVTLDVRRPLSIDERLLARGSEGIGVFAFALSFEPGALGRARYRLRLSLERASPGAPRNVTTSAPTAFEIER